MLKASGYRLLRLNVNRHAKYIITAPTPAAAVRKRCTMKGLKLAGDKLNPAQPWRYRVTDDEVTIEQVQIGTGTHAMAPPDQPDFLERFMQGEAWGGVVKTAKV